VSAAGQPAGMPPAFAWRDLQQAVPPGGRLLRHRADAGPVSFVLTIAAVQAVLYLQSSALTAAIGALVLWPLQTRSIYVAHNHHHHRIFRWPSLNFAFESLLFLQTGLPSYGFALHHNLGHHANYRNQNPRDPNADPHCWIGPNGRRLSRWKYTRHLLGFAVACGRRIGRQHQALWRSFLVASTGYGIGLALLMGVRPVHTLVVFVMPMALSLVALAWSTYVHHLGLPTDDPLGASYTDRGRWTNWWGYNIGYHTAHHLGPALHWSQLRALHERIAARVPAHCYYDGRVTAYARAHWPLP
jgi:beta-carotene hydroxylase